MKIKEKLHIMLFAVLTVSLIVFFASFASAQVDASTIFESGYVMLDSTLFAQFGAKAHINCDEIYVSSCKLQELDSNNKVIATTTLTPPDTVVKDDSVYTASADYNNKGESGKRYRIQAVFSAEGTTITRTSGTVTFK